MSGAGKPGFGALLLRRVMAVVLLLIGAFLAVGGIYLLTLGGSLYYLVTGLAVAASGVLIWCGDRRGRWMFGAMLAGTLAWSIWEVGFTGWSLVPRLVGPVVLGLVLLLPAFRGVGQAEEGVARRGRGLATFAVAAIVAIVAGAGLHALRPDRVDPLFQTGTQSAVPDRLAATSLGAPGDWLHYGNDQGGRARRSQWTCSRSCRSSARRAMRRPGAC